MISRSIFSPSGRVAKGPKGSHKNKFTDLVTQIERNRWRSHSYVEDFVIEEGATMALR